MLCHATLRRAALAAAAAAACRSSSSLPPSDAGASLPVRQVADPADTVEARRLFEQNIDAIHKRDRARYLSYYLQNERLARNGPAG